MPDFCGGAGGRARPSSPAVSYLVGAAAVAVTVETLGLSAIWADLIAYAAGQTFSPSSSCSGVPPAMPNFSDVDVNNILNSNPIAQPTSWGKLADLVHIGAWLTFCECLDGTAPTPPAAPVYPSGGPVLNSPSVPGLLAGPCWDRATGANVPIPFGGIVHTYDLVAGMLPPGPTQITVAPWVGSSHHAYAIPAGANTLTMVVNPSQTTSHGDFIWGIWSAAGVQIANLQIPYGTLTQGPQTQKLATLPSGAAYWSLGVADGIPNQTTIEGYALEVSYFCPSTLPGTPVQDCCPPDPILMAQLQLLINLVNGLYASSTPPPLGDLLETLAHPALHDGGSILLRADTIAVRIDITTDNPSLPTGIGVPPYLFKRGFIVPIALEGPIRTNVRLVYNPQLYLLPELADSIGYQLGVGIIATLTELRAGP